MKASKLIAATLLVVVAALMMMVAATTPTAKAQETMDDTVLINHYYTHTSSSNYDWTHVGVTWNQNDGAHFSVNSYFYDNATGAAIAMDGDIANGWQWDTNPSLTAFGACWRFGRFMPCWMMN